MPIQNLSIVLIQNTLDLYLAMIPDRPEFAFPYCVKRFTKIFTRFSSQNYLPGNILADFEPSEGSRSV